MSKSGKEKGPPFTTRQTPNLTFRLLKLERRMRNRSDERDISPMFYPFAFMNI